MIKTPMSVTEIRGLPASVPFRLACRALNIGKTKGYQLARSQDFPVPVIPVGNSFRVPRAAILEKLGILDFEDRQEPAA